MKRKKQRNWSQEEPRIVYSTVRALVLLDTDTLRKKELGAFKRIKVTHATLTKQLTRFEKEDVPEFKQWLHTHCGPLREKFQTESMEIFSLQNTLLLANELCAFYPKRTEQQCMEAAQHYTVTKGDIPNDFEEFFAPPPPEPEDSDDFFEEKEDDDDLRKLIDAILDDEPDDPSARFSHRFHSARSLGEEARQQKQTLKKLYRSVVQKLHPDRAGSSTPEQQELWHAAKHAYTTGDLQTLQTIEAQCDLTHTSRLKSAAISSIRSGILFYREANDKIRYEIRKVKNQPEWGFSSRPEERKMVLMKQLTKKLILDVDNLSYRRKALEREIHQMNHSQRKRSQRRRTYADFSSDFF